MTTRQGDVKKIAKLYGITPRSVNNALRYRVGGDRAEKIRRTALAMGAVQVGRHPGPRPVAGNNVTSSGSTPERGQK